MRNRRMYTIYDEKDAILGFVHVRGGGVNKMAHFSLWSRDFRLWLTCESIYDTARVLLRAKKKYRVRCERY